MSRGELGELGAAAGTTGGLTAGDEGALGLHQTALEVFDEIAV
jgi:hypothetical protein